MGTRVTWVGRGVVVAVALLLLAGAVEAKRAPPQIDRPVVDEAAALSEAERAALEARLRQLRERTGAQAAVLLVRSTGGEDIAAYALRAATAWGGGDKARDDGLLLVLAMEDRRSRLEVGYGLEARLPDVVAKRLLDRAALSLREGQVARALHGVLDGVERRLDGLPAETLVQRVTEPVAPAEAVGLFLVVVLLGATLGAWGWRGPFGVVEARFQDDREATLQAVAKARRPGRSTSTTPPPAMAPLDMQFGRTLGRLAVALSPVVLIAAWADLGRAPAAVVLGAALAAFLGAAALWRWPVGAAFAVVFLAVGGVLVARAFLPVVPGHLAFTWLAAGVFWAMLWGVFRSGRKGDAILHGILWLAIVAPLGTLGLALRFGGGAPDPLPNLLTLFFFISSAPLLFIMMLGGAGEGSGVGSGSSWSSSSSSGSSSSSSSSSDWSGGGGSFGGGGASSGW